MQVLSKALKREVLVVWLAARDPRVPIPIKLFAVVVAAYALSPIDLIPDFIPVLGLLDDLILIPIGIWLILKLLPEPLRIELRASAENAAWPGSSSWGLGLVISIWVVLASAAAWWLFVR